MLKYFLSKEDHNLMKATKSSRSVKVRNYVKHKELKNSSKEKNDFSTGLIVKWKLLYILTCNAWNCNNRLLLIFETLSFVQFTRWSA